MPIIADTKYRLGVVYGSGSMVVGYDGTWGNVATYDGGYSLGTRFDIFKDVEATNYWRELRGYHADYSTVRAEIHTLMSTCANDTPSIYTPQGMTYDGSTGYYSKAASIGVTGNKQSFVLRMTRQPFLGASTAERIAIFSPFGLNSRLIVTIFSNDHSNLDVRGKIVFLGFDSAGAVCINTTSIADVNDGKPHTVVFNYDGDLGDSDLFVDGVDSKTVVTETTGTLANTNVSAVIGVELDLVQRFYGGKLGYLGFSNSIVDPLDFYDPATGNQVVNESTWVQFGGVQPLVWAADGKLDEQEGSDGNFVLNGAITGPT